MSPLKADILLKLDSLNDEFLLLLLYEFISGLIEDTA